MIHQLVPAIKGIFDTDPPDNTQSAFHIGTFLTVGGGVCLLVSGDIFLLNKGVVVSERHDTTRHTRTAKGSE